MIILFQLAFLVTILICRGILLFMRPHTVFALQEIFIMCTKAAFANFLGKLSNAYEDLLFLLNWVVGYLILDTRHVRYYKLNYVCVFPSVICNQFYLYIAVGVYILMGDIFSCDNGFRYEHSWTRDNYRA